MSWGPYIRTFIRNRTGWSTLREIAEGTRLQCGRDTCPSLPVVKRVVLEGLVQRTIVPAMGRGGAAVFIDYDIFHSTVDSWPRLPCSWAGRRQAVAFRDRVREAIVNDQPLPSPFRTPSGTRTRTENVPDLTGPIREERVNTSFLLDPTAQQCGSGGHFQDIGLHNVMAAVDLETTDNNIGYVTREDLRPLLEKLLEQICLVGRERATNRLPRNIEDEFYIRNRIYE